jgi:hypothetical protein
MIKKLYCSLCDRYFYNGWGSHITAYQHRSKTQQKRIQLKIKEEKRQKENDFACQLASALEGYTLNPGDEVSLRDGRSFKADIHGTLFEIPVGS